MTLKWSRAVKTERPLDIEMTDYMPRPAEGYRRVEPIFDASGALKRHAMSKNDAAQTPSPRDKSGAGE